MKSLKALIIITCISVLLAALAVLLILLAPEFSENRTDVIIALTILPLWSFGIIPAYAAVYNYLKAKSFLFGMWLGVVCGVILPILISPALMVFYYVGTIENLVTKNRADN